MKYTRHALNVLTARSYNGIGPAWIIDNLTPDDDMESIVSKLERTTRQKITNFAEKRDQYTMLLHQKLESCCDGIVAYGDKDFPEYRTKKKGDCPVLLFYKGNLDLLNIDNPKITVIGLLNPEEDIVKRERKMVAEFVQNGATIVSGLALGCDSVAHRQALDSGGKTIAILPSPLSNILPAQNKALAAEIVAKGGLLITEYGKAVDNLQALRGRYTQRDRLQALFCDTIVLAASYVHNSATRWPKLSRKKLDSGARLAMQYAQEWEIPRAVMYDESTDKDNPMFDLNREIKETAAIILQSDNLTESVRNIMSRKANLSRQTSLFF